MDSERPLPSGGSSGGDEELDGEFRASRNQECGPAAVVRSGTGGDEVACTEAAQGRRDSSESASAAASAEGHLIPDLVESALLARFECLEQALERLYKLEQRREERFDRLHAELEGYRKGERERLKDPVLHGIVQLYDSLIRLVSSWREKSAEELTPRRFLSTLEGVREDVEVLLQQQGVEPFETLGGTFTAERQTVARTIPTDDETQIGNIAVRLRPGFEVGERLLVKERVAVYARMREVDPNTGAEHHE